ncbi:hypothetical protein N7526_004675 [Penicillium atrosanguineum]|nr:hypothetical protein N7526_004675 [Penicillium atrosanguineum]
MSAGRLPGIVKATWWDNCSPKIRRNGDKLFVHLSGVSKLTKIPDHSMPSAEEIILYRIGVRRT